MVSSGMSHQHWSIFILLLLLASCSSPEQETIETLSSERDKALKALEFSRVELTTMKQQMEALKTELTIAQSELHTMPAMQEQIAALVRERDSLRGGFEDLKKRYMELDKRHAQTNLDLTQSELELKELYRSNLTSNAHADSQRGLLLALEEKANRLQKEFYSLQLENSQLKTRNTQLDQALSELQQVQPKPTTSRVDSEKSEQSIPDTQNLQALITNHSSEVSQTATNLPVIKLKSLSEAKNAAVELNQAFFNLTQKKASKRASNKEWLSQRDNLHHQLIETQREVVKLANLHDIYIVMPGDSLSTIAKAKLGDSKLWTQLFAENQYLLKKPELIYKDMVLVIP